MRIVRCPSVSSEELKIIKEALANVWPGRKFEVRNVFAGSRARPTEVSALAIQARKMWDRMCQSSPTEYLDICIAVSARGEVIVIFYPGTGGESSCVSEHNESLLDLLVRGLNQVPLE